MPRRRIPTFTKRLEALCDEAGLPRFDRTEYDVLQDLLAFFWDDPDPDIEKPRFLIAVPLATAGVNGLTAPQLRGIWDRKFGPPERAEAA